MAKVDLLNNVLASGDKAQWQKTAQSKKALVEAAHGDRDRSTLRPVRSVQTPTEPDASWMQGIFTAPGQPRGGATPAVPSAAPVQTPELDAAVGNMPGTGTMSTDYLSVTGQDFGQATDKNPLEEQTPALVAWLRSLFAQGVSENRLGQDGAAAEMAGQSEEPAYTGDPEDVARQEWALYGAKNEAEYRKAAGDEAKYVGRQAAQGAMDTVRNTANDIGYRAQVGAGRAAAEDAYWADIMTGSVNPDDFSEYQKAEQDNTVTELKQASHLGESYAQKTEEMFPEVTDSMRQLGTLASGITGMAPQIALGAASLALGNAAPALASVLKVAGSATLFSSASGAATTDALYAGANAEDAVRYGTAVGMVEIATEKIANGLGLFGKAAGLGGVTDDLTAGLVRKYVNDKGTQKAILYLAGMLGEGFEEYIAEFADHFANKVMVGTDQRTWEQTGKDAVNSFIVGALISAVMQTSNVFQSGGNVTPEQMADIAADSMKQAEQTATQEAAPAETGTPATQPATATAPEITAPPTTTSTFATVPYAAAEIASRSAPQTSGANIGPTPHSYQEAQQQIDDYEDGLIAKYGEEEVLFLDPESKLNFSTFQPSKLSDAEINQLSVLYQGRDGIADSEKNTFIDSVMASVPSKDYTNDGWAATRDGIREALEEIYKDNARLLALHGQEQTVNLAETLYNILIRKTDAPHELWGQYDLAQYVSENPFSTPLGQTPAPLLEQINDIVNAIVRPTAPPSAVNLLPSPRAPVTAQEAPGEALAPGGVVTVPSPINAPTEILNQPSGVPSVAPAVAQNIPAAKPAVTVPNSAPANPSVQSAAPGSFDEMLQQSPGVHPVNAEGAANAQLYQNRGVTQVPTQNFQGHLTSKTASTIMNAGITPTALVTQMREEMAKGTFSRIAYTDEAAQASSEAHIADVGWDVALAEYKADTRAGKSSKDITALGTTLFNNALTNGDMLTAMDIATRMIENRKTTAQSLQATNMLNKTTPDGRLYMAMRSIDNIREQLIQKYGDKAPELKIDDTLMQEYYDALKSGDKETEKSAWRNVEQNIADQVPSTWKDKLNAWRYLSMLGNPRTHIRNIVGNAGFVPVRAMKNIIATTVESAFSLDGRTKAFLNYASSADRALINLAASDFKNMEEYIQSGGKYVDTNSAIEDMRTIFNVKPLEWLRKLNTAGLNKEDVLFSKPIYAAALASYWKANGITAQDIAAGNVSAEAMSTAQLYAAKEAAKATYRDSNWFSDWVSKLGKNYQGSSPIAKAANILVEGVIPFKRTPANILARAFEYSPAGLVKGIYDMTVNIKSGKVTAAEAIDTFSAGLTGTGLLALGALLAAHGLVSGSADDDEKQSNFDKLRGSQNYSITIGNKNYTLDWLAPEALPFFVGVEVFNHFIDSGANKSWQDFTKSLTGITEPLLETSMLSSLEELFSSIKYADGDYIGIAAKTAATSYLSQFMPTIFGQAERAFLETQREETYRYGESDVLGSSGQYSLGSLFNKVPGVDYNQIPYVNAWGEKTDTGNLFERIVNNFLNPAYVAKTGGSQADAELQRLYDLGFNTVLPSRAEQSKQIRLYDSDGNVTETTHMTADEYVAFNEKAGKLAQSFIGSMVSSDFYKGLNDDEKADMIERVYDYANQIATSEMAHGRGANYPVDTWVSNAMTSDNPLHYMEMYGMYGDTIYTDRYAALVQGGMTETEAGSLYQAVSDDLDGDSTNAGILSAVTSQNLSTDKTDVALKAYLPESAYSKYYTARIAGIAPQSYADYYRIQSGYGTSQADVYAAMNHTDWTPEQKATVWAAYGWKTNYDTYAASH